MWTGVTGTGGCPCDLEAGGAEEETCLPQVTMLTRPQSQTSRIQCLCPEHTKESSLRPVLRQKEEREPSGGRLQSLRASHRLFGRCRPRPGRSRRAGPRPRACAVAARPVARAAELAITARWGGRAVIQAGPQLGKVSPGPGGRRAVGTRAPSAGLRGARAGDELPRCPGRRVGAERRSSGVCLPGDCWCPLCATMHGCFPSQRGPWSRTRPRSAARARTGSPAHLWAPHRVSPLTFRAQAVAWAPRLLPAAD